MRNIMLIAGLQKRRGIICGTYHQHFAKHANAYNGSSCHSHDRTHNEIDLSYPAKKLHWRIFSNRFTCMRKQLWVFIFLLFYVCRCICMLRCVFIRWWLNGFVCVHVAVSRSMCPCFYFFESSHMCLYARMVSYSQVYMYVVFDGFRIILSIQYFQNNIYALLHGA